MTAGHDNLKADNLKADGLRAVCAPLPDLCHHAEYRIYVNGQYVENAGNLGSNAQHILESWQRSRRVKTVEVWFLPCHMPNCTWGQP